MRIGRLRHQITFKAAVDVPDGAGGVTQTWQTIATVWGAVEPLRGRELFAAQQIQAEITHKITTRYHEGMRPEMVVDFNGRIFDVGPPVNPAERNQSLEFYAVERRATGT
jgi:SPP1 family predicted phage head-tail adaptor